MDTNLNPLTRNSGLTMNRTLKFRVWDITNKRWLNVSSLSIAKDGTVNGVWELRDGENELYGLHQVDIVRFTGLKDSKGTDIYEGDILENFKGRYIVPNFTPLRRGYEADNILVHHDGSDDWISMSDVDWEVIGNIYENPNL